MKEFRGRLIWFVPITLKQIGCQRKSNVVRYYVVATVKVKQPISGFGRVLGRAKGRASCQALASV